MSDQENNIYHAASNENLFGVSPKVIAALNGALPFIHSYPSPDALILREAISEKLEIPADEVIIGSGSAELISLLIRAFCSPFHTTNILSLRPTYPLYRMEAEALGVKYIESSLDSSYQVDIDNLLARADSATRLCFISNPNNPTGTYLNKTQLERLIFELPEHIIPVIDEAYIEYTSASDFASALSYRQVRKNLVILRTFSKAYGLASLRVGYMIANEPLLTQILRIKQPYNVNQLAQVAACASLQDEEFLRATLKATDEEKQYLQKQLTSLGVQSWPSEGNFLLVDAGVPASVLYKYLQEKRIHVRLTSSPFALRITIGQKDYQDYLLDTLQDILNPAVLMQHPSLSQILTTGEAFSDNTSDSAVQSLQELMNKASDKGDAAERIAFAFARAFNARLSNTSKHAGNLYSSTYGAMDMISAFNVLVKATPLVTFGHLFANLTIFRATANASEIQILDLGIGGGLQWFHLLELLASRKDDTLRVHLTGIDIPATEEDPEQKIRATGEALKAYAATLGITFSYRGIASKLENINLLELAIPTTGALVVNSALTLHHIPDQLVAKPDERDRVLAQIKALKPVVFTLTEPDSEHNKLDYLPRLRESLRHYSTVFEVLDNLLPRNMPERRIIEQEFFAREIINIISSEGNKRVERHERNEAWQRRLNRMGFDPYPQEDLSGEIAETLALHKNFELENNGAGYTLHWNNTNVIAATAWH